MNKTYIPFLTFLGILLMLIPQVFHESTTVIPGWHTTIYNPYYFAGTLVFLFIFFNTLGYLILPKRVAKINRVVVIIHLLCTIPLIYYMLHPFEVFVNEQSVDINEVLKSIKRQEYFSLFLSSIFVIGQICFFVYFVKSSRKSKTIA